MKFYNKNGITSLQVGIPVVEFKRLRPLNFRRFRSNPRRYPLTVRIRQLKVTFMHQKFMPWFLFREVF